jgi:quercetin dioxygenase-like cupin family protein
MAGTPSRVRRFSSVIGDDALRFGDRILIGPGLGKDAGEAMSAYTASFGAGAHAELPARYAEVWVVLSGAVRVGTDDGGVIARAGDFVHVPEQSPGIVEALEDSIMVCVSVPAH